MEFKTHESAKNQMLALLAQKGIFDEAAVEAKCAEIVDSMPPSTKSAYAPAELADDVFVLAANYYDTYEGKMSSGTPNTGLQLQETGKVAKASKDIEPTLTDAEEKNVQKVVATNLDAKAAKTAATKIVALLVRAPKPSVMHKGLTVVPECAAEKLAKIEARLVDTVENKKAFADAKAAIESGKAVPVSFDDTSRKLVGVTISTPKNADGKGSNENRHLTLDGLEIVLAFELLCRIPSNAGLGVMLSGVNPVKAKGRRADTTRPQGKAVLKWDGKTEAIKAGGANVVSISEVKAGEFKEGLLPTNLVVEIYKMKEEADGTVVNVTKKDGTNATTKFRFKGRSKQIPVLTRVREYANAGFGEEKNGTTIFASMTNEDKQQAIANAVKFVNAIGKEKIQVMAGESASVASILEALEGTSQKAKVEGFTA